MRLIKIPRIKKITANLWRRLKKIIVLIIKKITIVKRVKK